jgi:hypoxanthine phosphoribosyltransferase
VALKAVLFGGEGILFTAKKGDEKTGLASERKDEFVAQTAALFHFLRDRGIRPIVVVNRDWVFIPENDPKKRISLDDQLREMYGDHKLYVGSRGDMPYKPKPECVQSVLQQEGLQPTEAIYVGISKDDFLTAHHGGLLFLNATWDRQEIQYGFVFDSPKAVERFIDLFALRAHHWFYRIDDPVHYRSLAPFSTFKEAYANYSSAARNAAKIGTPERHFFLNSLVSALYFSGEIASVDYIACVPRHEQGYGNPQMDDVLEITGGIFATRYLRDLVYRHKDAPSQRREHMAKRESKPHVLLSTIHLRRKPLKNAEEAYKNPLSIRGKRILVFDDFSTSGASLESVRAFLERAGANVLMVSWLKTINTGYTALRVKKDFDPYQPTDFAAADVESRFLGYGQYIVDHEAPQELDEALERFRKYGKEKQGARVEVTGSSGD